MTWILAFLPLFLILLLMTVIHWSAAKAGTAGWLTAILIGWFVFQAGPDVLLTAHLKAVFIIIDVLLIVWGAYLLYRVTDEAGAIQSLVDTLPQLTTDRIRQALLIGWVFATFLQGVGGFGVPVAITAPLLVRLGFSRHQAVIIPSIGHGWAVTFGSLALSFYALTAASGLPGEMLTGSSTLLLGLVGMLAGFQITHSIGGWQAVRRLAVEVFLIGISMAGTQFVLARLGLWSSASFGGGLAGLFTAALLYRRVNGTNDSSRPSIKSFLPGLFSYMVLIVIVAAVQYWQPLKDLLSAPVLGADFPLVETGLGFITPAGRSREIPLLHHTGTLLMYASLFSYFYFLRTGAYRSGAGKRILSSTLHGVAPSSLGIMAAVAMAVVMSHAGMVDTLAKGIASSTGMLFPAASPWIGALGAVITGSNTNSNVIFASLQLQTARLLGLNVALILAAQTAGGAIGSAIAPSKIIVGASTTGMTGHEGQVMKALLKPIALQLIVLSVVVWLLALLL
ncbi:MAG: L-lactate permease [Anaerolineales bacterium]|nr:L-lactate permease [Anaerolineales bacterium]